MVYFVTGVCGQLGNDVVNELNKRGFETFHSDILYRTVSSVGTNEESPIADPYYCQLDITDKDTVIAVSGGSKKDFLEKGLSKQLEEVMENKV